MFFQNIFSIEYDRDESEQNVMGPKEGCLPCHKPHWDYVKRNSGHNLVDDQGIYGVMTSSKCGLICSLVPDCSFWRYCNILNRNILIEIVGTIYHVN